MISRLRNASLLALLCIIQNAQSTEYTQSEETAPSSAKEIRTPLDAALEKWKESRDILLHDLYFAIDDILRKNGIEIPFPQRQIHVKQSDLANIVRLEEKSDDSRTGSST